MPDRGQHRGSDRFLGYTIARLATVMQARMEAALMAEIGIGVRQFAVLAHLAEDPGMGSGELARLVMITPQSMGPLVDKLAKQNLLCRQQAERGRKKTIELTASGRRVLQRGYRVADRLAREEQALLGDHEVASINDALLAMLRAFDPGSARPALSQAPGGSNST